MSKDESKDEYLITDVPLKALTVFAMPMILGSFFQQVYNMADSIIVGQFVGSSALAAVGACAALTNVFICVALGAGVGAGVLVSRYFGARNYSKMKTIVSTSLISFLVLSVLLGIFGFGLSHPMMSLLQTPADILDEAVLYLRVYFVGFPFLFMYNILSTMFTSIGESKIPLVLLIFSSVLNIAVHGRLRLRGAVPAFHPGGGGLVADGLHGPTPPAFPRTRPRACAAARRRCRRSRSRGPGTGCPPRQARPPAAPSPRRRVCRT